ncbi:uncharacterized protein C2orf72 homolog [Crotalus tigris]|uniref:uncharacterized protein C2orf72 homolog n=1 Tax=Crotalus tigris TaxID=88082 RepID=UPI00192FA4EE|nr:uncharacterized protein C2orf72 homolog [Crotalus tigris]
MLTCHLSFPSQRGHRPSPTRRPPRAIFPCRLRMMGSLPVNRSNSISSRASWASLLPPEAAPAAGVEKRRAAAEGKGAAAAAMDPEAPRELRALLARAGGRQPLLLAGEARPAELETFARDLLAEAPPPPEPPESPEAPGWQQRRARVRGGGDGLPSWRGCALLLALFRAASLEPPRWARERRRLREILRDLRAQLPSAPPPAVVGVVLLLPPAAEEAAEGVSEEEEEAARLQLEALLRRVFREGRRRLQPAGLPDTLQAVTYRPGDAQAAREAACRALRAALKLRADGSESPRPKLPAAFSWCLPWGRRNEDLHTCAKLHEDALQDLEGAIALTNIAPNGKCEEASEGLGA